MLEQIPSFPGVVCLVFDTGFLNSNRLNGKSISSSDDGLLVLIPGCCSSVFSLHVLAFRSRFSELSIFIKAFLHQLQFYSQPAALQSLFMPFIFLIILHIIVCHLTVSLPVLLYVLLTLLFSQSTALLQSSSTMTHSFC